MVSREVLVDTSGFYALLAASDRHHAKAVDWMRKAAGARRKLVTTDYVLDETATLLKMRRMTHVIERFFDLLEESRALRIEWIEMERFKKAQKFFLKHQDQEYSFTDCVSFIVMRELGLAEVLTTDNHFQIAGFEPLLI